LELAILGETSGIMGLNDLLKLALPVIVLLIFAAVGVGHVMKPDWFIKRSGVRRGGEMLTEWNRLGFQICGAIFSAFAVYGL
jgi:hypothetical protein